MKRIILSIAVIAIVGVATFAGTQAFFSDTETSQGNAFVAGAVDIEIADISDDYLGDGEVNDGPKPEFTKSEDGFSFELADLKPLDHGEISYELTNDTNDAHVCAMVEEVENYENGRIDPEREAGDTTGSWSNRDAGLGELQNFLSFGGDSSSAGFGQWFDVGELSGNGGSEAFALSYCFGDYNGTSCDPYSGPEDVNVAQTDGVEVDVSFYAEQTRNNPNFSCDQLNGDGDQREIVGTNVGSWSDATQNKDWVAKGRYGGQNTYELEVGFQSASSRSEDEHSWTDEQTEDFELTYDGSGEATLTVGNDSSTYSSLTAPRAGSFLSIIAKTADANDDGTRVDITNVELDGVSPTGSDNVSAETTSSTREINSLDLTGDLGLTDGFTLTGEVKFDYGSNPTDEGPAFEIVIGQS